jgi:hypothetical protein
VRSLAWMRLGSYLALLLGASPAEPEEPDRSAPVLEILSPDRGDRSLGLEWPWGSMAVKHVMFNDHRGSFKAVVESSAHGVRVRFEGWGKEPFTAVADKEIRVIYRVPGRKAVDFTAEATATGDVRVMTPGRPKVRGRRIVLGLGGSPTQGAASASVEGSAH